tara:strand:+ start:966 stop:1229 length:264 start_codon:yes stop_codon:yes gene_type:complete
MPHTKFNNGDRVIFSNNVKNKTIELAKDPFWIEALGQEYLDRKVEESKMTYTVDVVVNSHTKLRVVEITRPDGKSSFYPDESLILVK